MRNSLPRRQIQKSCLRREKLLTSRSTSSPGKAVLTRENPYKGRCAVVAIPSGCAQDRNGIGRGSKREMPRAPVAAARSPVTVPINFLVLIIALFPIRFCVSAFSVQTLAFSQILSIRPARWDGIPPSRDQRAHSNGFSEFVCPVCQLCPPCLPKSFFEAFLLRK